MPIAPSQRTPTEDAPPPCCAGKKLRDIDQALLWQCLHDEPECPPRALLDKVASRPRALAVSVRHRKRLRATGQRQRPQGRPRHGAGRPAAGGALVQGTPPLS